MNELRHFGLFDVFMVGVDVFVIMFVVKLVEELREGIFDFFGSVFEIDMGKFLDEFRCVVGDSGNGGVGKVVDAVAEGVAFDFLVDGEGAAFVIVVKFHLRGIE